MSFFLYKGLKKPLVFFGLKDKYIYYAIGIVIGSFMLGAILSSLMGIWGLLISVGFGGGGVGLVFKTQDKNGLYNKTKNSDELHIIPIQFKNVKILKKVKNENKK